MPPITPEQRRANLARGRATAKANREARKAAQQAAQPVTPDAITMEPEPDLQVEVNVPEQPVQKLSLKDRLFGNKATQASKPATKATAKRTAKKQENNLFSTVLPTVIASFVATYSRQMLQEPYKVCAPSREEVNGILAPLMAIIGRRVEIVGKASQDVIDVTNALICSIAYGTRAYITYVQIKQYEEQSHATNTASQPGGTYPNANAGITGYSASQDVGGGTGAIGSDNGVSDHPFGTQSDADREAALIADMLRRDKSGRVRLGLLAG